MFGEHSRSSFNYGLCEVATIRQDMDQDPGNAGGKCCKVFRGYLPFVDDCVIFLHDIGPLLNKLTYDFLPNPVYHMPN